MNHALPLLLCLAAAFPAQAQLKNELGTPKHSPKGTFTITEVRDKTENDQHRLWIQKKGSTEKSPLVVFPRFITWAFSADERFLALNDALGSGECDVQVLERSSTKPFYVKRETLDPQAWKAFQEKRGSPLSLFKKRFPALAEKYPMLAADDHHNYTCAVKWLGAHTLLIYLVGDGSITAQKDGDSVGHWTLGPGYFFVYDCTTKQLTETALTKRLNQKSSYQVTQK